LYPLEYVPSAQSLHDLTPSTVSVKVPGKHAGVGADVGQAVGKLVGAVGAFVGDAVGYAVGNPVGALVGDAVGNAVGYGVGTATHSDWASSDPVHLPVGHRWQMWYESWSWNLPAGQW